MENLHKVHPKTICQGSILSKLGRIRAAKETNLLGLGQHRTTKVHSEEFSRLLADGRQKLTRMTFEKFITFWSLTYIDDVSTEYYSNCEISYDSI